mmetsp:Transcript_1083/g.2088  ORF Transcript_1083/g.2088 Transcript_1083/m.2088 type:complete len:111 (-) Transcript_1083:631-963(-)
MSQGFDATTLAPLVRSWERHAAASSQLILFMSQLSGEVSELLRSAGAQVVVFQPVVHSVDIGIEEPNHPRHIQVHQAMLNNYGTHTVIHTSTLTHTCARSTMDDTSMTHP